MECGTDMARGTKRLTHRAVETARAGTHEDGDGLRLVVSPNGSRRWVFRFQMNGRRRDMGFGPWPEVSLSAAREKLAEARRLLKAEGLDPLDVRQSRQAKRVTFRDAAEALIQSKRHGWKNAKHAAQWPATLATYVYPKLGARDVAGIGTEDVLSVLRPIWTTKPETASRVRMRIEAVLGYATATGARTGDNPARWRGHLGTLLPARAKVAAVEHHAAMRWQDAPAFVAELRTRPGAGARALLFAILTAARSGEVRGATWREVDRQAAVWTVPAHRMKAGREHRVPLSPAALALLGEPGEPDALLFPSDRNRPLSDATLGAVLRRMGHGELTAHGFRATFRDWAGETTAHPREVIEAALAHRLKDKAEAAYARGDLFQKRRRLMDDWASYLAAPAADVVRFAAVEASGDAA